MLMILMILNTSLSISFLMINHPLSMGLILLMQTTLIALITGSMSMNFWFSYILFMIMIGGMLVLFIYMTSVASNEKFNFSYPITIIISMSSLLMIMLMMVDNLIPSINKKNSDYSMINNLETFSFSMSKYLNFPLNYWMLTLIVYLLITLIAVVKITNIEYGPLRQKF